MEVRVTRADACLTFLCISIQGLHGHAQVVELKQQANKALKQMQHEVIEAEQRRSELQQQVDCALSVLAHCPALLIASSHAL